MTDTYECTNCHTIIDENNIVWCECEHCDNIFCPDCAETILETCELCGAHVTDDCLVECYECNGYHCKNCEENTYTCHESDKVFCNELCHESCRACMSEYQLPRWRASRLVPAQ